MQPLNNFQSQALKEFVKDIVLRDYMKSTRVKMSAEDLGISPDEWLAAAQNISTSGQVVTELERQIVVCELDKHLYYVRATNRILSAICRFLPFTFAIKNAAADVQEALLNRFQRDVYQEKR